MANPKLLIFLIGTIIGLIVYITVDAVKHKKHCEKKENGCDTASRDEEIRSLRDSNSTLARQIGQLQASNSYLEQENSAKKQEISTKESENKTLLEKLNSCDTPLPPTLPPTTPVPPATNKASVWKSGIALKTALPISIACLIGVVVLLVRRRRGSFGMKGNIDDIESARSSESDGDAALPWWKIAGGRPSSARQSQSRGEIAGPSQSGGFHIVGKQHRDSPLKAEHMGDWLNEVAEEAGIPPGDSTRSSTSSSTSSSARSSARSSTSSSARSSARSSTSRSARPSSSRSAGTYLPQQAITENAIKKGMQAAAELRNRRNGL